MCSLTKYLFLVSVFVISAFASPCQLLGEEQNTSYKRHLTNNEMVQKSLSQFEKKFESIKNMPWDYKYRRHNNKIDWDLPKDRSQNSGSHGELSKKNELFNKDHQEVKNRINSEQTYPKEYAKESGTKNAVSQLVKTNTSEGKMLDDNLENYQRKIGQDLF